MTSSVSRKRASPCANRPSGVVLNVEVETGFEPVYTALQAVASPLGHSTSVQIAGREGWPSERTTGLEPATLTLAR